MDTVLALDFGTQGAKGMLLDSRGGSLAIARAAYGFRMIGAGVMEQSPEDWWEACTKICMALRQSHPAEYGAVCAVGVCGQMHGAVLIDKDGNHIDNCIVWCDTRSTLEAKEIEALFGKALCERLINKPVSFYTAPKLLWIARHRPQALARARKILFCKDYIRYRISGKAATDHSDASGSLLYDFQKKRWSGEAIRALGLHEDLFAKICDSCVPVAAVNHSGAALLGLREGTPIAAGAGDLACSILGSGLSAGEQALVNLGTAGQVLALHGECAPVQGGYTFEFLDDQISFSLHAIPSAAYCLRWFMENVTCMEKETANSTGENPFALMDRLAQTSPPGAGGLLFAPYLNGTGSPYFDDRTRGAFVGLTAGHTKADMTRAILEGVCYGICDCLEAAGGVNRFKRIYFSGGGAGSALWRSIMADTLGREIFCPVCRETACVGAGLIAGTAAGMFPSYAGAAKTVGKGEAVVPDDLGQSRVTYASGYAQFQKLYAALSGLI